ncbi:MAG TPA: coenzyme F420-0:L-glutamate ligase [Candidatus Nitrosopolaris sp.]|nr:coenzyme F420-0:L-glutamate ligase [Candidatus Nitrosopolaris sp.]
MTVKATKTRKVTAGSGSLEQLLDESLGELEDSSIVVITSKVVSLCEKRVARTAGTDKEELIKSESDLYLPKASSKYSHHFTILRNTLVASAGIDESNAGDNYALWPLDPQLSANKARAHLAQKFGLKNIGVIITDSVSSPLRFGTRGTAIAYTGFAAMHDYRGELDLFGYEFRLEQANIAEGLASAAVVVMGEGAEQTPLAIITNTPFVRFQDHNPTEKELKKFHVERIENDLFEPFLRQPGWRKGGHRQD